MSDYVKNVDYSLDNIALKSKVNMDEILPLLPYEEKINHLQDVNAGLEKKAYMEQNTTIINLNKERVDYGLYNCVPNGFCNWYEFATLIKKLLQENQVSEESLQGGELGGNQDYGDIFADPNLFKDFGGFD